jgi:hypothetical protein
LPIDVDNLLPINVDNFFIPTHIDILWPWLKMSKTNYRQLHFVKWSTCNWQQLNNFFGNFWIMHSWRWNHRRIFKSWPWMKFSIIFGVAFVRRLWNSFEPFWKNEGKTSHSLKELPSKFFTTYHIKKIINNCQDQ